VTTMIGKQISTEIEGSRVRTFEHYGKNCFFSLCENHFWRHGFLKSCFMTRFWLLLIF